jgi:hypothetical protein
MLLSTFNQEDLRLPSKKKKKKKEELRLMKVVTDTFIYIYSRCNMRRTKANFNIDEEISWCVALLDFLVLAVTDSSSS